MSIFIKNKGQKNINIPYFKPCRTFQNEDSLFAINYNLIAYTDNWKNCIEELDLIKLYCSVGFNGYINDKLEIAQIKNNEILNINILFKCKIASPIKFVYYILLQENADIIMKLEKYNLEALKTYLKSYQNNIKITPKWELE